MGAGHSAIDPRYTRIWNNLSSIESPHARIQMIETLLSGQEYVLVAKQAGVYAGLLQWIASQRRGEFAIWPHTPPKEVHTISRIPPPKRALDVLTESYILLDIDDTKPLTHESLKAAYKRAVILAHPDKKGGSSEKFDAVTKAFLYIQEVLEKLLPKTYQDGPDPRFKTAVTPESALRARGIHDPAPKGTIQIEDKPMLALNPKKLDMNVFNQLFEENRLPDPDKDDGYGNWLKTNGEPQHESPTLRTKFNKDIFHKTFEEDSKKLAVKSQNTLSKYKPPSELTLAPNFGAELGGARPEQYTKQPTSNGIGYTDLKFAYSEGSTFSHEIADVPLSSKSFEQAKKEYGSAPKVLSADESAAILALERAKEVAEETRRRRLAARDVDIETVHERLQKRLTIQNT